MLEIVHERNVNISASSYVHPISLYIVNKVSLVIGPGHVGESMKLEKFVFLNIEVREHNPRHC